MRMTEQQRAYVSGIVETAMLEDARALSSVDQKLNPGIANEARQRFHMGAAVLAAINAADDSAPFAERIEHEGMDVRALAPRCVHGIPFAEPCPLCPLPDNDLGSSN